MFKKRLTAFVIGAALVAAMAGAALWSTTTLSMPAVEAIACHSSGSSGGGC